MRRFVFDCDTGTDDAIAIMAAFGCKDIEILGITSVNGNVVESHVSKNNLDLCECMNYQVPVCRGAEMPLSSGYRNSSDMTHGKTGLGSVVLPEAKTKQFDERVASQFIYEMACTEGGELELIVTGPMTNIALAIIKYPDFVEKIKHMYFMGGSVWGGNVTTTAEFNIWADPEAARVVFQSGIPLTMVGLDVTLDAIMEEEDITLLKSFDNSASKLTADLLEFMVARRDKGGEDIIMHDALAVAAAVFPECMEYEDYWMDVETRGEYTRGHTHADFRHRTGNTPNVHAAVKVDVPSFRKWLVDNVRQSNME